MRKFKTLQEAKEYQATVPDQEIFDVDYGGYKYVVSNPFWVNWIDSLLKDAVDCEERKRRIMSDKGGKINGE